MPMTIEQLAKETDSLPWDARVDLIEHLLQSISPPSESSENEQRAIVRRRVAEIRANPDATIPAEEVFAEMKRLTRR